MKDWSSNLAKCDLSGVWFQSALDSSFLVVLDARYAVLSLRTGISNLFVRGVLEAAVLCYFSSSDSMSFERSCTSFSLLKEDGLDGGFTFC